MWRTMAALALISIMACAIPGCLQEARTGNLIYIDEMGGILKLNGTPMRIIALTPALTEIVFLLGCGDRLVGIDSDSNYPPEASNIEKVSSWQGMNTERIVSIGPDLVLMDKTLDGSDQRYDQLIGLGLPVYRIFPADLDSLLRDIEALAKVLDVEGTGDGIVEHLQDRMDAVSAQAAADPIPKPTVLHIVYYDGASDPWVMTSSTFSGDLVEIAGGGNAIEDTTGLSVQISLERIISVDPDIMICSQSGSWPTASREEILSDPALKDVSAVRSGSVKDVNGDIIDRTGPRLIDGLEAVRNLVIEFHTGG